MCKKVIIDKVRRIQAGQEELMADLFVDCYHDIYKMAYKFCKNEADANDIVQDTFLELTKSIYHLRNPEYYYVWVHRIVKSKCIKLFRKEKYIAMEEEQIRNLPEMKECKVEYLPFEQTGNKEDQALMRMLVASLPEHYRIVIEMVYFDQLSMDEVQAYLDIPMGTVKSRLFTGKKKLKQIIKAYEKAEGRKIHFYDMGSIGICSICSWKAVKELVQERMISASLSQAITYSVITVSCAATTILTVDAGTRMMEEQSHQPVQAQTEQAKSYKVVGNEQITELPVSTFSAMYQGIEIKSEKDAYFILIDWLDDRRERTEEEKNEIKPIYDALHERNGMYWNLIQQQGYSL